MEACANHWKKSHAGTRQLSRTLGCSQSTINRRLRKLDYVLKRPRKDPHNLTQEQARRRIDVCTQLLQNPLDDRFWRRIVTCDEKWIFFNNPVNKRQWVPRGQAPQPSLRKDRFGKKVMISVWWNFEGVLLFEMFPEGQAVNSEIYCNLLDQVYEVLKRKYPALTNRKNVLLQHDNAPCHRSRMTQDKIKDLDDIEVLLHPAYSPDIAPSDYSLFRSMTHFLNGQRFDNNEDVKNACQTFFASKTKDWYRLQISHLAYKWSKVIEHNGLYFDD